MIRKLVLFAFLAALSVGAYVCHRYAEAQVAATPVKANSVLQYDHDGKDVAGASERLKEAELALSGVTSDLNAGGVPVKTVKGPLAQGANEAPLTALFQGQQPGMYRIWVRAVDEALNVSAWSAPLLVNYDLTAPTPVTGVRVKITIEVSP